MDKNLKTFVYDKNGYYPRIAKKSAPVQSWDLMVDGKRYPGATACPYSVCQAKKKELKMKKAFKDSVFKIVPHKK